MSPFLRDQNHDRDLHDILCDGLCNNDTYLIVSSYSDGVVCTNETDIGRSFDEVVSIIGSGDCEQARAVIRIRLNDGIGEAEDETLRVAYKVASYITKHAHSPDDVLWNNAFMNHAWPGWKLSCWREWQAEEGYRDDARFYAGYGR